MFIGDTFQLYKLIWGQVEQLKKQKAKKSNKKGEKKDTVSAETLDTDEKPDVETTTPAEPETKTEEPLAAEEEAAAESATKNPATGEVEDDEAADTIGDEPPSLKRESSVTAQSRVRSSSFRQGGPLSPSLSGAKSPTLEDGISAPEIYRKQAARIEELEKENKRLAKEASDGEKRYKKAEDELEDLREAEPAIKEGSKDADAELEKLVSSTFVILCINIANMILESRDCIASAPEHTLTVANFKNIAAWFFAFSIWRCYTC